ncbi:MAG: penicillin-binding protein 2 [Lentisphaeraceae bacterium]|nr:penicillin-binding protein 2 [Lentisphaeraceae bacterium]
MLRAAYQTRIVFLGIVVSVGFVLLVWRLRIVQIDRHFELSEKARSKYTSSIIRVGVRGNIYDGVRVPSPNLLAASKITYDILAAPERMGSRLDEVVTKVSNLLELDEETIRERFESGRKEIVIKNKVEPDKAQKLQRMKLPGMRYVESSVRFYPKDSLLCHVLGFLDHNGNGVAGIEKVYNQTMTPKSSEQVIERTRKAHTVAYLSENDAMDGKNIHLTIMEPIQAIVEEELDRLMQEIGPKACYAIMANPKTGAIMALAQRPNFNPNERTTMKPENYNPKFLLDVYDPGSTMKGISIAGVLEYNTGVSLGTVVDCEAGIWNYGGFPLRDAGHNYGKLKLWEVIQKSSNIGTAKLALTIKRMQYSMYRDFGFGESTGIGLGPESKGILPPEKRWSKVSYTRLPIGQGISVTPLQMVQAYCALANNGKMYKLHIVDKISDARTGDIIRDLKPMVKKEKVIDPATAFQITEALKSVTKKGGTATQAAIPGFEVAGKTGTAQKVVPAERDEDGRVIRKAHYSNSLHVSSFIGYVPADKPEMVLYIVVDEPPHKRPIYYGGFCAAPYFKRIAEQTLNYLNVSPREGGE